MWDAEVSPLLKKLLRAVVAYHFAGLNPLTLSMNWRSRYDIWNGCMVPCAETAYIIKVWSYRTKHTSSNKQKENTFSVLFGKITFTCNTPLTSISNPKCSEALTFSYLYLCLVTSIICLNLRGFTSNVYVWNKNQWQVISNSKKSDWVCGWFHLTN